MNLSLVLLDVLLTALLFWFRRLPDRRLCRLPDRRLCRLPDRRSLREVDRRRPDLAPNTSPNTSDLASGSLPAGSSGNFESGAEFLTTPPPRAPQAFVERRGSRTSSVCSDDAFGGAPGDAPIVM